MPAVTVTTDDRGVATITLAHPPINLMTVDVFIELAKAAVALAHDDDVRVVVMRSADPEWFVAHFDVEAILGFPDDAPAPDEPNSFQPMCAGERRLGELLGELPAPCDG